jgi:hypothetical protein
VRREHKIYNKRAARGCGSHLYYGERRAQIISAGAARAQDLQPKSSKRLQSYFYYGERRAQIISAGAARAQDLQQESSKRLRSNFYQGKRRAAQAEQLNKISKI